MQRTYCDFRRRSPIPLRNDGQSHTARNSPIMVDFGLPRETPSSGAFKLHAQRIQFGATELQGLKVFLTVAGPERQVHTGNCVACHTPPQFTDHRFHNTGVSQAEYDGLFGRGAFAALEVPGLAARDARFDAYLPASGQHPLATSRFRSAPSILVQWG